MIVSVIYEPEEGLIERQLAEGEVVRRYVDKEDSVQRRYVEQEDSVQRRYMEHPESGQCSCQHQYHHHIRYGLRQRFFPSNHIFNIMALGNSQIINH